MAVNIPLHSVNFGRLKGKRAWRQNLGLASMSATKIESALGPKGAYKMVTYNRGPERVIKVTKDAVEMLAELEVQYPAVKTIAEAARLQREDVGDGVSTFVILLAGLLRESESLMDKKVHPNIILRGYLAATKEALRTVESRSENRSYPRERLLDIVDCGRGVLTPRIRAALLEAAERADSQGGVDLKRIKIMSKSGASIDDTRLIKGVVVKKVKVHPSMPDELKDVKLALVNKTFDNKPLEVLMKGQGPFHIKLDVTESQQIEKFKAEESRLNEALAQAVEDAGAKIVVCRAKIIPQVADAMSRRGILAFEMIDQQDMDALSEATGARAIGDVRNLAPNDLGTVQRVWTEKIEGIDYFYVEAPKGSTILLRGSSVEDIAETERVVKNAVRVFKVAKMDPKTVLGGGAIYMEIATRLREYALGFDGREQVAIQSYANVLEDITRCLIRNYGLRWSTTFPEIRAFHASGKHSMGIDWRGCSDMDASDTRELSIVTRSVIRRTYEVTALLLRIDEYFYVRELPLVHKK